MRRACFNTGSPLFHHELERIAGWIIRYDGGTYTLKGSLVVEIHNILTGDIYGTYDTNTDFTTLTTSYG